MASRDSNYDHHITIFSPQGRLYQIEYAIKCAQTASGLTSVAVRGADACVLVTQKKVADKLIDASSVTHVYKVTEKVCALMTGLTADERVMVSRMRYEAMEFKFNYGYDMPVHHLAKRVADLCQVYTQQASLRALATICILAAVDDEKGPQLFKVDPAGHYWPYKAAAAGAKESEAGNWLEKKVADMAGYTTDQTIQCGIMALQSVLSADFKGTEIEVAVLAVRRRQPITREERLRADQHASVIGGQWQEALAEMRRRWWGNSMLPALIKVTRNMRRWFQIGTTKGSAERRREKSRACHNREQVLEELCRFAPVHTHREYFAVNCFLRQGFKHLIILIVLVFCIFQMLGTWWTLDSGKSLAADLRQIIVDNDFDAEHNTFRHIDRWEDWWNFAYGSIVPLLTAQQMYNGVSYRGELHVSPVLLRQVRAEANSKGVLPVWGPGSQTDMEEKLPLEMTMCAESEGAEDVRDGCAWSKPPHSNLISAWTYGLQFRKYPASGYIVQLDKDNVTATLQRLQQGGWFDAATRFVSMEAMVYSESRDRMAYVNLAAEVSESGWTKPVVRVLSFMPSDFTFWHWLFMVVFVAILGNEAITILDIGPRRYFTSFGHCANLVQAGSIFAIFICQMSIISQTSSFKVEENVDPWVEKGQLFNIDYSLITFVQVQRVCASISILLSMLKFIGHFRNLSIAGPIVLGILELLRQPVIIWFLVCYSWLLLGFAMCFYVLSTDVTDDSSFSQVYMSFATMVRAGLSGDMEFGSYTAMDTLFGPMVFVVFIVLSQVIMTNLFIAIVADEYSVAKASGERIWKNNIALLMAQDLISSLPVDSSGQIDMLSQAMLVGHDVRTEPGAVSEDART